MDTATRPVRILVVEDDEEIAQVLQRSLRMEGYEVRTSADGEAALADADAFSPDLVILDLGLPKLDGIDVARTLRADGDVPILMLTARDAVDARVAGLDAGADDYLVKPFAYEELAARLRALSRRSAGPIALDERSRRVTVQGKAVDLSPREFSLLECLLRHPGQSLTRDQLLDQAWPFSVAVTPNAVDAYVHYLRTKLGAEGSRIETVRGVGYRLADA